MKNRKTHIVLVLSVVVIWVLIITRVSRYSNETVNQPLANKRPTHKTSLISPKDTFRLLLNYPDPFLGDAKVKTLLSPKQTKDNSSTKRIVTKTNKKKSVKWPNIQYHGTVKSTVDSTVLGLIMIDNRKYLSQSNDSLKGILIEKITEDTLFVKFQGEVKALPKNIIR